MKIKILSSNKINWYYDYIDQIFELIEKPNNNSPYYNIKRTNQPNNPLSYMNWVHKKDAILLNREFKLIRILADHIYPITPELNENT